MFNYFSNISYNFGITGGTMSVNNIFKNVNIIQDSLLPLKSTQKEQDERPDQISYKLYQNFDYYWVLLKLNDASDPLHHWNNSLVKIVYLDNTKTEKIKNTVRDAKKRVIDIKTSEL